MSWNFDRILYKSFSNPKDLVFDGRFIVVLDDNGLHFIDYRDQQNISEDILIGDTNFELEILKTISVTGNTVTYFDNHYYVTNAVEWNVIYKINYLTGLVDTLNLPHVMNSNLASVNGKLWMTTLERDDNDEQQLFSYDGTTWVFNSIPCRHQIEPRYIATDYRGNVLVTNFNDVSISKHDSDTGVWISDIRISREPYYIKTISDRTCFVASSPSVSDLDDTKDRVLWDGSIVNSTFDTGILYAIDTVLDTQQTNFQTLGKISGLTDNSGDLWLTIDRTLDSVKSIARLTLSNNQVKFTKAYEIKDITDPASNNPFNWNINESKFLDNNYNKSVKCESYSYQKWDGTSEITETVPTYKFIISDGYLQGFKIDLMYNTQFSSIQSTAMMAVGNHNYTGD